MSEDKNSGRGVLSESLMGHRTVFMSGEITEDSVNNVSGRLLKLQVSSSDRINLIIDSGGGGTHAALKLCDLITHFITAPVRGIAMGLCSSAATFIMLHCFERLCTPYTRFVIHSSQISGITLPVDMTTEHHLEQLLAGARVTSEKVVKLYMEKLKKNREEVEKLIGRGDQEFNNALSAAEALEVGLVQRIIDGKLDIFPGPVSSEL